jgi:hypothetical protein
MASPHEDPAVRSARREAIVTMLIFAAALAYTIGYCAIYGYRRDPDSLRFVFGFPDWVFWGVVVPWVVCVGVSYLFGAVFMADEQLGIDHDDTDDEFGLGEE